MVAIKMRYRYVSFTASKVSKYGVFSGLYFPVLGLNTGIYGAEKPPYLETFYAVYASSPGSLL